MGTTNFKTKFEDYVALINNALEVCLPKGKGQNAIIFEAVRYSALAGGKRIRPMLLLEFNRIAGGSVESALPFACAIEMIHTYSLIHDDLPCMDNDDLRRGKPTCHRKFGEDIAVLAGDALLNMAFEVMLSPQNMNFSSPEAVVKAAYMLARSAGIHGMIGGQVLDIDGQNDTQTKLNTLHSLKTGSIIAASAVSGCILAGAEQEKLAAALEYGEALGLAFQIKDDLLDVYGDSAVLGKDTGNDRENGKATYPDLLGKDECQRKIEALTKTCVDAANKFEDAEFLAELAVLLSKREK